MGYDVEVKDETRFPERWRFFTYPAPDWPMPAGNPIPKDAGCLACHSKNAAVENTFVQFYPTLLEIAKAKGTLNPSYVHAEGGGSPNGDALASVKPTSPRPASARRSRRSMRRGRAVAC